MGSWCRIVFFFFFFWFFPRQDLNIVYKLKEPVKKEAGYLREKKKKKGRVNEPRLLGRQEGMGSRAMIEEFALVQNEWEERWWLDWLNLDDGKGVFRKREWGEAVGKRVVILARCSSMLQYGDKFIIAKFIMILRFYTISIPDSLCLQNIKKYKNTPKESPFQRNWAKKNNQTSTCKTINIKYVR